MIHCFGKAKKRVCMIKGGQEDGSILEYCVKDD